MKTALLVIAHGSREEAANAELQQVVAALRGLCGYDPIERAYLELAEPDIERGAARCVSRGAGRVILLPYFLSPGVHVTRDLSAARSRLSEKHPGVAFCLAEPLGPHPLLLDILVQRAQDACSTARPCPESTP